jgi:hypothetical protein
LIGKSGSGQAKPALGATPYNFPANGPVEFLYLDRTRVIAYLAQLDGGTFNSEQLSRKLSNALNGELALQNVAKFGGSSTEEDSLARDVTPTAAADYFELLSDLEGEREKEGEKSLATIALGHFNAQVHTLHEGQFVSFNTHGLRSPIYLNPYLATRQHTTLDTLFPPAARATVGSTRARRQRARALHFRSRLGKNPRVIFALRPLEPEEIKKIEQARKAKHRSPSTPETGVAAKPRHPQPDTCLRKRRERRRRERRHERDKKEREEEDHVLYLMPMNARLLTRERSLVKFGGGEFTVVGKVVRVFPEPGDAHSPAYVDSPTLETWEPPLAHAPLRLLCSTDRNCREAVRKDPEESERPIRESRCRDLEALREQTEIPRRGAVILPIAIYK